MINFAENLNKMITAGLGGETEAPRTEIAVGHRLQYLDASGPVASFDTNIVAPLKKLMVNMLPVQAGSGDPSPDNVRPITGFDAVTLTRAGKNLLTIDTVVHPSGVITPYTTIFNGSLTGTFTISIDTSGASVENPAAAILEIVVNGVAQRNISFTFPKRTYTGIITKVGVYASNAYARYTGTIKFQLEIGSTDTDYTPCDGQSLNISLGQTVYGGTLDVPAGKLMVTMGFIASYAGESLPGEWISDRDVYAPGATPTARAQVCYELAEPVEIDLEPQQITTLIGDNNVWSDAGDVDVTYIYYEETEGY